MIPSTSSVHTYHVSNVWHSSHTAWAPKHQSSSYLCQTIERNCQNVNCASTWEISLPDVIRLKWDDTWCKVLVVYIEIKVKVTKCVPMRVDESNETSSCTNNIFSGRAQITVKQMSSFLITDIIQSTYCYNKTIIRRLVAGCLLWKCVARLICMCLCVRRLRGGRLSGIYSEAFAWQTTWIHICTLHTIICVL